MKITHVALNSRVTDGFTYQDNLLPKYHKILGFEVSMITSKYIWNNAGEVVQDTRDRYINDNGVKIMRLNNTFGTDINSKLKKYDNVFSTLEKENPDILFIHGVQFIDMVEIVKYIKSVKNIDVYVDNHADFSNSATNWLSKNILHRIIWKKMAKLIEPYVKKFYGVLPARIDFLVDMYAIPRKKVELLVMGIDDEQITELEKNTDRERFRKNYGIKPDDFLIVTGGKIDYSKQETLFLMEAIKGINNPNIKLLIFGSIIPELEKDFEELLNNKKIQYIGWLDSATTNKVFYSANLVVFPGRHSVFWEQVVGLGIPLVVKYWEGTTHVNIGGNCVFLYENTVEEMKTIIENIYYDEEKYNNMLDAAQGEAQKKFLYSNIAKKSIK